MISMNIIGLKKDQKRRTTSSLFLPSGDTLTENVWRRIVIELPKDFPVPGAPPPLRSRARLASFPRVTVWHGIREVVAKRTAHTNTKPQNLETRIESQASLGVVPVIVQVLQDQKGRGPKSASFGNRVGVIAELNANSPMKDLRGNLDKLLRPVRPVVIQRIRGNPGGTTRRRDQEAPVTLRVQRVLGPQDLRELQLAPPSPVLLLFVWLHPCWHQYHRQ